MPKAIESADGEEVRSSVFANWNHNCSNLIEDQEQKHKGLKLQEVKELHHWIHPLKLGH